MTDIVYGVDISKSWIDAVGPDGHEWVATGDLDAFAARVAARRGRVVFEACGGYERPLRAALARAGVAAHQVMPARARQFARSLGLMAKTDKADAGALREMGLRLDLPETPPEPENLSRLKALRLRRRQLVQAAGDEKRHLKQTVEPDMRASVEAHLAWLAGEIAALEKMIAALIASDEEFCDRAALLRTAPGVGPVAVAALLADLPELGALTPGAAGSLTGLAPVARDSGQYSGRRRIGGGRKPLRDSLYMAGLSAARCDPALRAFAERLKAKGRTPKQAIIAVTRKLVVILNAMIRDNRPYSPAE